MKTEALAMIAAVKNDYGHSPYCAVFFRAAIEEPTDEKMLAHCSCAYKRMADAANDLEVALAGVY